MKRELHVAKMYETKSKQSKGEKGCWGGPSSKQMLLTLWAGSVTLQALWRKKRLEQKLAQTHRALSILEVQPVAIENATTKAEVLCTMDLAAQGMKKVCQEPPPQPFSSCDFQGLVAIGVADGLSHRLEQLDFIRGLLRLELEHPGVLEDI
ncbi:hypothetical protein U0070_006647 [Myodes glareolus]|uniref:Uncharacterized protein n=1 Tax=Myodes glareolus TaxID=447135 RepID=A0AAW0HFE5_MYOGA